MRLSSAFFGAVPALASTGFASPAPALRQTEASGSQADLYVSEAPQHLRPYVLPKLATAQAVRLGNQVYRFSVTGNSSDGAFTLMQTNAPDSTSLGVLPHIHKQHYENFYCTKGRFQLWAQKNTTGAEQQTRILTQGDYGAVPHDTTHTFQILDPDTQITGIIQPGGFEALFLALSEGDYPSVVGSEFIPANLSAAASTSSSVISALESFDVWAELAFDERTDAVNGLAGGSGNWHNGSNAIAADGYTPNFIAKNYGPKYLRSDDGGRDGYAIVAPMATTASTAGNFTLSTVTLSLHLANMTVPSQTLSRHTAFQVEEGELSLDIQGYKGTAKLIQGDVAFIPNGTRFTYYASRPFTKFLVVSSGVEGLDEQLLKGAKLWEYASYPEYA